MKASGRGVGVGAGVGKGVGLGVGVGTGTTGPGQPVRVSATKTCAHQRAATEKVSDLENPWEDPGIGYGLLDCKRPCWKSFLSLHHFIRRTAINMCDSGYAMCHSTSVKTMQITLRTIIGIAGIGLRFDAYDRPKCRSNNTDTINARTYAAVLPAKRPAIIKSAPLAAPAINDGLLFARAKPKAPPAIAAIPNTK